MMGPPFALIFPALSRRKTLDMEARLPDILHTQCIGAVPACIARVISIYLYLASRNRGYQDETGVRKEGGCAIRSKWHRENANTRVIASNAHEEFLVARALPATFLLFPRRFFRKRYQRRHRLHGNESARGGTSSSPMQSQEGISKRARILRMNVFPVGP